MPDDTTPDPVSEGLEDPRFLSPGPAGARPDPDRLLELVPLSGPTEASTQTPPPEDDEAPALRDPRFLMPGPDDPLKPPTDEQPAELQDP